MSIKGHKSTYPIYIPSVSTTQTTKHIIDIKMVFNIVNHQHQFIFSWIYGPIINAAYLFA